MPLSSRFVLVDGRKMEISGDAIEYVYLLRARLGAGFGLDFVHDVYKFTGEVQIIDGQECEVMEFVETREYE